MIGKEPIAIVGMGMKAPDTNDVDAFWKNLEEKRDMTREIPKERFNTDFWCSKEKFKGSSVMLFAILFISRYHSAVVLYRILEISMLHSSILV
jgi:hypothetical protein